MPVSKELNQEWTKKAQSILLNKKIIEVRYLSEKEMDGLGWYQQSVVFVLDDGTICFVSRDDEGNNSGALFYQTKAEPNGVLPVL